MERLLTAVGAAVINDEVDLVKQRKEYEYPILSMSVCEYAAPKIIPLLDIVRPLKISCNKIKVPCFRGSTGRRGSP
jgi:hypothetical protein